MTDPHARAVAAFGFSLTDFHLLVALDTLEEASAWQLAGMLQLDPAAVSRSLARLAAREDVARTEPRPRAPWHLTDHGRETMSFLSWSWEAIDTSIRRVYSPRFVEAALQEACALPFRRRERGRGWCDD